MKLIFLDIHEDWKTPRLHTPRHLEILAWLEGKKVASFIIIDDSEDAAHEGNGTLPIFIHTDYDQGIPFNNYQACYAHFTWC